MQQQDLHLETTTVREALEFSAILRQSDKIPRTEKIAYVEEVIHLLEMESFADAVVGSALSAQAAEKGLVPLDPFIEPTVVTWDNVIRSVESNAESLSFRNAWIEGVSGFIHRRGTLC